MPVRPKVGGKADQELVVVLEYTTVTTIIRKPMAECSRKQEKSSLCTRTVYHKVPQYLLLIKVRQIRYPLRI